jgi:hypothetical protein
VQESDPVWLKDGLSRSPPLAEQLRVHILGARQHVQGASDALGRDQQCDSAQRGLAAALQRLDAAEQLLQAAPPPGTPSPRAAAAAGKAEAAAAAAATAAAQAPLPSIHIVAEPSASSEESGGAEDLRARNEELEAQLRQLQQLVAQLQEEGQQAGAQQQQRERGAADADADAEQQQAQLRALVVARGSEGSAAALFHSPRAEALSDDPPYQQPGLARHGSGGSSATWATAPTQGPSSAREILSAREHLGTAAPGPREQRGGRGPPGRLALRRAASSGSGGEQQQEEEQEEDAPVESPRAQASEAPPSRLRHLQPVPGSAMSEAEADQGLPLAALQRRGAAGAHAGGAGGAQAYSADAMQRLFGAGARELQLESPRAQWTAAAAAARVGTTSPTPSAELERVFAASFGRRSVGSSAQGASPGGSESSGSPGGAAGALGLEGLLGALQQLDRRLRQGSPSLLQALGEGLESCGAEELQQRLASAQRCSGASTGITRALQRACGGIRRALAARQQPAGGGHAGAEGAESSCESSMGLHLSEGPQSPLQVRAPCCRRGAAALCREAAPRACRTRVQLPAAHCPAAHRSPAPLPRLQVFSPADAAFLASSLTPLAPSRCPPGEEFGGGGDGLLTPVHRVRLPSGSPATLHQNALFNGAGPSPDKGQARQPGAMAASMQVRGPRRAQQAPAWARQRWQAVATGDVPPPSSHPP